MKKLRKKIFHKAYSMMEMSLLILIIGILVAGVTQGSRLIQQFRLQNARTLTQSSPVASIKDLATQIIQLSPNLPSEVIVSAGVFELFKFQLLCNFNLSPSALSIPKEYPCIPSISKDK